MHIVFSFDLTGADSEKNRGFFEIYLRALGFTPANSVSTLWKMPESSLSLNEIRDRIVDHAHTAKVRLGGIALSRGTEFLEENHPTTTALDRLLALGIGPSHSATPWSSLLSVPPPMPRAGLA
jgi:hypothetical protein